MPQRSEVLLSVSGSVGALPASVSTPSPANCIPPPYLQEVMSGSLKLVGPGKHSQSVTVKVYHTSLEHFAVLYPQKKVCRPLGVLNLRNTVLERLTGDNQPGFSVRQRGFDTPMSLTFLTESPRDLESWVHAFTSRTSPATVHQTPLPILEEDEEV